MEKDAGEIFRELKKGSFGLRGVEARTPKIKHI